MKPINPQPETPQGQTPDLQERVKRYLLNGGLFNPEVMQGEPTRDLIMDLRDDRKALAEENRRLREDGARLEKEAYLRGYEARLNEQFTEQPEPKNPTLWRYLQNAFEKQITFHAIGVNRRPDGGFHFYVHPQDVSGETEDYLIWPDPFSWDDMIVNKKDSPPPDVERFKSFLAKTLSAPAAPVDSIGGDDHNTGPVDKPTIPGHTSPVIPSEPASRAVPTCFKCGQPLGEDEAKCFTVCERCWDTAAPDAPVAPAGTVQLMGLASNAIWETGIPETLEESDRILAAVAPFVAAKDDKIATLEKWKKEALAVESWWNAIDAHIRAHPEVPLGRSVAGIALEWLKERDELEVQLAAKDAQAAADSARLDWLNMRLVNVCECMASDTPPLFEHVPAGYGLRDDADIRAAIDAARRPATSATTDVKL